MTATGPLAGAIRRTLAAGVGKPVDELVEDLVDVATQLAPRRAAGLTTTRTHTRYFGGPELDLLRDAFVALEAEWDKRRPFVDHEVAHEGNERLSAVRNTIARLDDRAG